MPKKVYDSELQRYLRHEHDPADIEGDFLENGDAAGGDLSGTYPNPSVQDDSHSHTPGVSIPAYPVVIENFIDLDDTPASYGGQALKALRVNAGETALEFTDFPTVSSFLDLDDTPSDYTDQAEKVVRVKADETGLEFAEATGGGGVDTVVVTRDYKILTVTNGLVVDVENPYILFEDDTGLETEEGINMIL